MGLWTRIAILTAAASLATGCFVDTAADERTAIEGGRANRVSPDDGLDIGSCRVTLSKGCFDGHVVAKKDFFVDGKQFFNADDLASRFRELITVKGDGAGALAPGDYALSLPPLDNESFALGFEYYLTGSTTRTGKIGKNGNFNLHELPEGVYDLRVQKSVRFTLTRVALGTEPADDAAGEPAAPNEPEKPSEPSDDQPSDEPAVSGGDDAPAPAADDALPPPSLLQANTSTTTVSKSFCATIYADTTVDVRRGKRLNELFSDFKMHVTDNECGAPGSGAATTTLTLAH